MVVSKISAVRENGVSALAITKGARDMDSTPPAITIHFAGSDGASGRADRFHAGSTKAIDG